LRFRALKFVDVLHDGGNAGVEVPPAFEVERDLGDGLVEFAQQGCAGLRLGRVGLRAAGLRRDACRALICERCSSGFLRLR
jgi:hypothetical protein